MHTLHLLSIATEVAAEVAAEVVTEAPTRAVAVSTKIAAAAEMTETYPVAEPFLNVHIVGDDEMDKSSPSSSVGISAEKDDPFSPTTTLRKKAKDSLGCETFDEFKVHLRDWWQNKKDGVYQNDSLKKWESWSDISPKDARNLIGLIS